MNANLTFVTGGFLHRNRLILVNDRIPRTEKHCALCGRIIEKTYVRDLQTRLIYFFCVSTNLTTGTLAVHRDGPLVDALHASISIPGLVFMSTAASWIGCRWTYRVLGGARSLRSTSRATRPWYLSKSATSFKPGGFWAGAENFLQLSPFYSELPRSVAIRSRRWHMIARTFCSSRHWRMSIYWIGRRVIRRLRPAIDMRLKSSNSSESR